jgi:hypothetical protein
MTREATMVMGVDDLLMAAASAAAEGAAEGVAKGLVKAVLGFLITQDDLAAAIARIEAYIGKQFDDFRNDDLTVKTFAVDTATARIPKQSRRPNIFG